MKNSSVGRPRKKLNSKCSNVQKSEKAEKLTNDVVNSLPNREKLGKSIMVPDSTTESLSAAPSPMNVDIVQVQRQRFSSSPVELALTPSASPTASLPLASSTTALATKTTSFIKSVLKQHDSPLAKPLLQGSIDDDVMIIKQAEERRVALNGAPELPLLDSAPPADTTPEPPCKTAVDQMTNRNGKSSSVRKFRNSEELSPPVRDRKKFIEQTPPLMTGRRRLCQTNFFQVVYPEPKRKKIADSQNSPAKSKLAKPTEKSTLKSPSKGWKGKSNVLSTTGESAQSNSAVAESTQPDDIKEDVRAEEAAEKCKVSL